MGNLVKLCVFSVVVIGVYTACPRGWIAVGEDCLMFAKGHTSWLDAARSCKHYNRSVLATIDSYEKMSMINTIAKVLASPSIGMSNFWVGGNDFGVEGEWRWEQTNLGIGPFTNWAPGDPNGNSSQNCMLVGFTQNSTETYWKDAPCTGHHNYICQISLFTGSPHLIG
ncbi:perlucin-like protein isoform X2 [Ostrea edulis]|uniref:perlucin-like protein isoform X2 n=1 Tax=Ostrea edulis TaxID=37623 RepID=UPI0024AF4C67|nr:perlucin-like protein isoform X2 [Ostrea edulis]